MLGSIYGFYPQDIKEAWLVDSTIDAGRDVSQKFWDVLMANYENSPDPAAQEAQKKQMDEYIKKVVPTYLSVL
jgi:hypothetical protein